MAMPLRTAPRITAFRPGQSPPLVRIPIFMFALKSWLGGIRAERHAELSTIVRGDVGYDTNVPDVARLGARNGPDISLRSNANAPASMAGAFGPIGRSLSGSV